MPGKPKNQKKGPKDDRKLELYGKMIGLNICLE